MIKKNLKIKLCGYLILVCHVAAYANTYLYGKLAIGVENDQFSNTAAPGVNGVIDYGSYFGIRGGEQITSSTMFIWQVEQLLDTTTGQGYYNTTADGMIVPRDNTTTGRLVSSFNQLATSDSYIGLQSTWGTIKLGNLSNYLRSNMGSVDTFNYANGSNGLYTWSRTSSTMILPNSFSYNSSVWHGFTLGFQYSFDNLLDMDTYSENSTPIYANGQNGYYSGGIYSYGVAWTNNNFKINYGGQLWSNVGSYGQNISGIVPISVPSSTQYSNAYINRLEASYNDPSGVFAGIGVQITDGMGWYNWANSGGSFDNYIVNPGFNNSGLDEAQYQTQEFAFSVGYHLGRWAPKLGYAYGNNLMYGGSLGNTLFGVAKQIPDSGYQQIVLELDLNIDPQTLLFVNYGQIWFGSTLQNISYCGANCNSGNPVGNVNSDNQAFYNQSSMALGVSHTF